MFRIPFFLVTGLRNFTKGGYERAAAGFDASTDGRDLRGRAAAVTGANQGIGFQVSLDLASRGATLYMVCRSEARGAAAVAAVRDATGNANVHLKLCDVSSLASIAALSAEFEASAEPLALLVNNAGVMIHDGARSADGLEINFATNTLGPYALTRALEPALRRGAPSRVIFVSSGGALTEGLEIDDLEGAKIAGKKDFGSIQYARDKRRQLVMAEALAVEWGASAGPLVLTMHPGWTETEGVKTSIPGFYSQFKDKLRSLAQGADTVTWLAVADADALEPAGFYLDRAARSKHLPLAGTKYAPEKAAQLLQRLDALIAKVRGGGATAP